MCNIINDIINIININVLLLMCGSIIKMILLIIILMIIILMVMICNDVIIMKWY